MKNKQLIINNIEKLYLDESSNDLNEIYNIVKDYRRKLYKKQHVKHRKSTKALEYEVVFNKKNDVNEVKIFKTLSEIANYYETDKSRISYIMYSKKTHSNDVYNILSIIQKRTN